jgi:hypothetical protein
MNRVRAGQGVFYAGYVDAEQDADDHRQDDKDREQLIDETELGRLLGPPACYFRGGFDGRFRWSGIQPAT